MIGIELALATALSATPPTDPIAPAKNGMLQCYTPNPDRKTCRALASYRIDPKGLIDNIAVVLINADQLISMKTHEPVTVKAGAICGQIHRTSIQAAEFEVAGQAASPDQAETLRSQVTAAYDSLFGKEICTSYRLDGSVYQATATIDGKPSPDAAADTVIWVSPGDGYTVGR